MQVDGDLMLACLGTIYWKHLVPKGKKNDNRKLKMGLEVTLLNEVNPSKRSESMLNT